MFGRIVVPSRSGASGPRLKMKAPRCFEMSGTTRRMTVLNLRMLESSALCVQISLVICVAYEWSVSKNNWDCFCTAQFMTQ